MSQSAAPTREVGRKFHADGTPRAFPGNTIICFVAPESAVGRAASVFQAALQAEPYGAKFFLLPPSSFHMTVMELLCDQVRVAERWSSRLSLDSTLPASDAFFAEHVPAVPAPAGLVMRVHDLYYANNIMLTLEPAHAPTATALQAYRAAIAEVSGVRFPDHDSYGFHISLAYQLYELSAAEQAAFAELCAAWAPQLQAAGTEIALPPPELTAFDDMTRFVPMAERHALPGRRTAP
jgi:hypothetical protein